MKFTDEDLKRLKEESSAEDYSGYHQVTIDCADLDSLLHRLECAEKVIENPHHPSHVYPEDGCSGCEALKAWWSSKGER